MTNLKYIDTHAHLDGEEYKEDLNEVILRAREAGATQVFVPAIGNSGLANLLEVCAQHTGFLRSMIGVHPEEVNQDWQQQLALVKQTLHKQMQNSNPLLRPIAVGEVGLDFYWSKEFEQQQCLAFEEQVKWAVEYRLPLMIHCRKAQQSLVRILRKYQTNLAGGVFHCFTGNDKEAQELLSFEGFALGIGGVLTFKNNNLREMLPQNVPLNRIVLETDSPYITPVPHRGKRNESAYLVHVISELAQSYGVSDADICRETNNNAARIFGLSVVQ